MTKNVYIGRTTADGQFQILETYKGVKGLPWLKGTYKAATAAKK